MIKEAPISDDFTFPTITDNNNNNNNSNSLYHLHFPSFTTSSLWYVSSTVSNLGDTKQLPEEGDFGIEGKPHQRRSFSLVEGGRRIDNSTRERELSLDNHVNFNGNDKAVSDRDEEKMDMLWEDFNEESGQPSSDKKEVERRKGRFSDSAIRYESDTDGREMGDLYCVQALKVSKGSSMLSHRRPSLFVILKVLKKLFLIHNSHCPKKTSCMIH